MYRWEFREYKPFLTLTDEKKKDKNIIGIRHVPASDSEKMAFLKSSGYYFIGISSYQNFPGKIESKVDIDKTKNYNIFNDPVIKDCLIGWCYCQRDIDDILPKQMPRILLPESDFMNKDNYSYNINVKKEYDFIYNCQKGDWQDHCRNWKLAEKCIDIMVNKYNLKIVLIGKKGATNEPKHKNITSTDFLNHSVFKSYMSKSKYIFVPNIFDASPRVVSEAFLYNLPVLENKNIIGGWHYINEKTGMQFNDINDFEKVLCKFLEKKELT